MRSKRLNDCVVSDESRFDDGPLGMLVGHWLAIYIHDILFSG